MANNLHNGSSINLVPHDQQAAKNLRNGSSINLVPHDQQVANNLRNGSSINLVPHDQQASKMCSMTPMQHSPRGGKFKAPRHDLPPILMLTMKLSELLSYY